MSKLITTFFTCFVLSTSFSAYAGIGSGLLGAGLGYLFGRSSSPTAVVRNVRHNPVNYHTTNITNIYHIDTTGIESEIRNLSIEVRKSGPNYTLYSEDKRDLEQYYRLKEIGPFIGVHINSSSVTGFVQDYGKPALQNIIEDRIKNRAISMIAMDAVLTLFKSLCDEGSASEAVLELFNLAELAEALEVKAELNNYTSKKNREYNILSDQALNKYKIDQADFGVYFDSIIKIVKKWKQEGSGKIGFLDLKGYESNSIVEHASDELILELNRKMSTAKADFRKSEQRRCNQIASDGASSIIAFDTEMELLKQKKDRLTAMIKENEISKEELRLTIEEGRKSWDKMYESLFSADVEYITNVEKVAWDFWPTQEYRFASLSGDKWTMRLNTELSGEELKDYANISVKEVLKRSIDTIYDRDVIVDILSTEKIEYSPNKYNFESEMKFDLGLGLEPFGLKQQLARNALNQSGELIRPIFTDRDLLRKKTRIYERYIDKKSELSEELQKINKKIELITSSMNEKKIRSKTQESTCLSNVKNTTKTHDIAVRTHNHILESILRNDSNTVPRCMEEVLAVTNKSLLYLGNDSRISENNSSRKSQVLLNVDVTEKAIMKVMPR